MKHALVVIVSSLLAFVSLACDSVARREHLDSKAEHWKDITVAAPSDRVLWELILLSVQNMGFPLAAGTDPGARQVESGWKTDMQPFKGEGRRWRATVRMTPVEKGHWKLEARVMCEKNDNLVAPLDPVRAEWTQTNDDEQTAAILLHHVQSRLKPELEVKPPTNEPPHTR